MKSIKKALFCLILLSGLIFPLSAEKCQPLNQVFEQTLTNHSGFNHDIHPRKKLKKKRKTILDRKHKMRNGHTCPSF